MSPKSRRALNLQYYEWPDLTIGTTLHVYGRQLQIYDVDDSTRAFYREHAPQLPAGKLEPIEVRASRHRQLCLWHKYKKTMPLALHPSQAKPRQSAKVHRRARQHWPRGWAPHPWSHPKTTAATTTGKQTSLHFCPQVDFDMGPKRPPLPIPPHDGLGSEEDSLQNVLFLLPKPPAKPYSDYLENWVCAPHHRGVRLHGHTCTAMLSRQQSHHGGTILDSSRRGSGYNDLELLLTPTAARAVHAGEPPVLCACCVEQNNALHGAHGAAQGAATGGAL